MAENGNGGSQFALTVRRAANLPAERWTDERIAAIARTVAPPDAGPAEVAMFLAVAARYDLDPFLKEIWLVKDAGRLMVLTGRDSFLKTARRDPAYEGYRAEAVYQEDAFEVRYTDQGIKIDHEINGFDRGPLVGAYSVVYVKGRPPVFIARRFDDYRHLHQKDNWRQNPEDMLLARVITASHRLAFSISGLYTPDEAADAGFTDDSARAEAGTKNQLEELKTKLAEKKRQIEAEKAEIQDAEFTVLPDESEAKTEGSGIHLPDWDKDPTIPANPDDDPEAEFKAKAEQPANARGHKPEPPKTDFEKARALYFLTWKQVKDEGLAGIPALSGLLSNGEYETFRADWQEAQFSKRSAAHFSEEEFRQGAEMLKEGIGLFDPSAVGQDALPI